MAEITSISRVGVLGHSGSGKTTSAHKILEDLRNKRYPVAVLDHKNEYSGLPGCAIRTGSQVNPRTLPKILRESNGSIVIQMGGMGLPAKRTWIAHFLKSCQTTPRQIPMMIVIEEVRLYCPQSGKPISKEPIIDLASGGRSQGYGCMLISQRASQVDKDAISQLTDLIILRHPFKTDMEYFEEWLGKDYTQQHPQLQVREAFHVDMNTGLVDRVQFQLSNVITGAKTPEARGVDPTPLKKLMQEGETAPGPGGGSNILPILAIVGIVIVVMVVVIFLWYGWSKREERRAREEGTDSGARVIVVGIQRPPGPGGPDYLVP
ncbi:MAG: DUF87 domain-containing protein [Candidatus Aenigmatarchaeota archaeon]|nr:MAG: DUF87 domain-containing protein [Candidatus Aenigmarchaeota archaeon]